MLCGGATAVVQTMVIHGFMPCWHSSTMPWRLSLGPPWGPRHPVRSLCASELPGSPGWLRRWHRESLEPGVTGAEPWPWKCQRHLSKPCHMHNEATWWQHVLMATCVLLCFYSLGGMCFSHDQNRLDQIGHIWRCNTAKHLCSSPSWDVLAFPVGPSLHSSSFGTTGAKIDSEKERLWPSAWPQSFDSSSPMQSVESPVIWSWLLQIAALYVYFSCFFLQFVCSLPMSWLHLHRHCDSTFLAGGLLVGFPAFFGGVLGGNGGFTTVARWPDSSNIVGLWPT